jgi:hypothetical protein
MARPQASFIRLPALLLVLLLATACGDPTTAPARRPAAAPAPARDVVPSADEPASPSDTTSGGARVTGGYSNPNV